MINTFVEIDQDDSVKVIVLDIADEKLFVDDDVDMANMSADESLTYAKTGHHLTHIIEHVKQPTIVVLDGITTGKECEIAISCDIRIATNTTKLGLPQVVDGVLPGWGGGSQRLARIINIAKAKEIIYTGRMINAKEALQIGLVNSVVPSEELVSESGKIAHKIAKNSAMGVQLSKITFNNGRNTDLDTGLTMELLAWRNSFTHKDRKERMSSFLSRTSSAHHK